MSQQSAVLSLWREAFVGRRACAPGWALGEMLHAKLNIIDTLSFISTQYRLGLTGGWGAGDMLLLYGGAQRSYDTVFDCASNAAVPAIL